MQWSEFSALLSGIGPDTPLGRIVSIRSEDRDYMLEHFSKDEHRIRNEWNKRKAKEVSEEKLSEVLNVLKNAFVSMAGGDTH